MSPIRPVQTAHRRYDVVDGGVLRASALVIAPIEDAAVATGFGDRVMRARALDPFVSGHVTGPWLVLTGRPELALPNLATADAFLHARLSAADLAPQDSEIRIPMGSPLPYTAPPIMLASPATAMAGRVTAAAFPHAPVAGATLTVGGAVPSGRLIGLRCPLALAHDAGIVVRNRALAAQATTALTLPAAVGDQHVTVASTASATAGRVLAIGTDPRGEHAVVVSSDAVTGRIFLGAPLQRSARSGAVVTVNSRGATSGPTTLARAVDAADGVLVTAADLTGPVVEISDSVPARAEFRLTGLLTDADGYWRLDGVRGVPSLELTTAAAGFTTDGPTSHPLEPRRDPNVINVELTV
jgi:hypothetical protein